MNNVIALANLFGQDKDGRRFPIKVEIGAPYQSGDDPETWRCPVNIDQIYSHLRDIAGADFHNRGIYAIALLDAHRPHRNAMTRLCFSPFNEAAARISSCSSFLRLYHFCLWKR